MKKDKLQVEGIANELEGASLYFSMPPKPTIAESEPPESEKEVGAIITRDEILPPDLKGKVKNDMLIGSQDTQASSNASMQAISQDDIVETIRKTVKQVGAKTLFIRLTPEEKHELTSIVYTFNELFRGEGRKTSENEIGRIGIKFLLEDYKSNGENSILAKVLAALNA